MSATYAAEPVAAPPPPRAEDHLRLLYAVANQYRSAARRQGLEIDDLVNEGSFGLLRAVRDFDPGRGVTFGSYAHPCIEHAILAALRRRRHRPWQQLPLNDDGEMPVDDPHAQDADVGLLLEDDKAVVRRLLRALFPRERRVVEWYFWQGLTLGAIGRREGISDDRVRQILTRALQRLRLHAGQAPDGDGEATAANSSAGACAG